MESKNSAILWMVFVIGASLSCAIGPLAAAPDCQDTDRDCVPDGVEAQLLSVLAPVWVIPDANFNPPLPLEWSVRHCLLKWYNIHTGAFVGETAGLTIDLALATIDFHRSENVNYHYRLSYLRNAYRYGDDDTDRITWDRMRSERRAVYGRVSGITANRYLVQYFMSFGYNETDTPPSCDAGNHEGDWIAVQFEVEATDPGNPRIYDCVFHNHGRQIFVESPAGLEFDGTHPRVYLERGTDEPWPFGATYGFRPGHEHPFVSTNERLFLFDGFCTVEYETSCNQGYTAVREHEGHGGAHLIASVVNVGENGHPYPDAESRFFQNYFGLYGDNWDDSCYWFFDLDTKPPAGPRYQSKIWDRAYPVGRVWDTWDNQANVFVSFGYKGVKTGSLGQPVAKLSEALAVVATHGSITLAPGASGERLTAFEPCTITVSSGAATIGQ